MSSVKRYDRGELKKPTRRDTGWLQVEAYLSRTGVFPYLQPDGSLRYELRLAEDVFNRDALASFGMVPVTDEHPPEFLTAANTREFARGTVGEQVVRDGDHTRAALMITDADLAKKLEDGEAREVSCGYTCDLEFEGGTFEGQHYDAIQRNIRGNHVAIVPRGRMGPSARVRMDAESAAMLSISAGGGSAALHTPPAQPSEVYVSQGIPAAAAAVAAMMARYRVDGVDVQVASERDVQLLEKHDAAHAAALQVKDAKISELEKALEKERARADAEAEKAKVAAAELKAAPEKLRAEITARADLLSQARGILGKAAKFDGLTDRQVKEKVLAKLNPKLDTKDRTDAYVDARFELALEERADAGEGNGEGEPSAIHRARAAAERGDDTDEEHEDDPDDDQQRETKVDSDAAFKRMKEAQRNAWKGPQAAKS